MAKWKVKSEKIYYLHSIEDNEDPIILNLSRHKNTLPLLHLSVGDDLRPKDINWNEIIVTEYSKKVSKKWKKKMKKKFPLYYHRFGDYTTKTHVKIK